MKKKLFVLGICIFSMLGFAACGSDADMSYEDYDLNEYIKVGKYKGLEAEKAAVSVTEEEIDAYIQSVLESSATSEELDKETVLENGDTVNIDYVGKIDGKKFDGGSAEGQSLLLGSGSFIDGFESGLVGKMVGDKVELNLTFPKDYSSEDLQGKDVVFTVTINSATRQTIPEYNLDFVQNTTEYTTLEEYEVSVEEALLEQKETEAVENQKMTLWSAALENCEVIEYPERELEFYMQLNSDQMDTMAEAYDMTREELLASYDFGDEEEFAAVNEDSSKLRIKQEMLIEYIAAEEGLEYTEEEKEALVAEFEASGYTEEMIEEQTGRTMDNYIRTELLYQKVLEFLLDNAEIVEASDDDVSEEAEE